MTIETAEPIGIGTDLVDLDRFRMVLARSPGIVTRLFTDAERSYATAVRDPTERFGGRFAVKEAVMKAMGVGLGAVQFRDIEVTRSGAGSPGLELHGSAASLAAGRGARRWLVTISHTEHLAQATVVALGAGAQNR